MKKLIIIFSLIFLSLIVTSSSDNIIIPEDAIRFRVIANSNDEIDQVLKLKVKDKVQTKLITLLEDSTSKEEASTLIKNTLPEFDSLIKTITLENEKYQINYGMNYFPKKVYKGVEYSAGNYESLVITLGEGQGDNWWCVLFPPLCLLEAEETIEQTEVEYKFFIQEILDKFFNSN